MTNTRGGVRSLSAAMVATLVLLLVPAAPAVAAPGVPADSGYGRRIVYDKSAQRVWLVHKDQSIKDTYPVSGHLYGTLPGVGRYRVQSKSRYTSSLDGSVRMEYMVRFVYGSTRWIGFHSIPVDGSGRLIQPKSKLGTPTSSGCIRQGINNARTLYRFADIGTKVIVIR